MTIFSTTAPNLELHLLVDDVPLLEALASQIRMIRVEQAFNLPAVAEIEMVDSQTGGLEGLAMLPGSLIQVRAVAGDNPVGLAIFSGRVETLEVRYDDVHGLRTVVRAFDGAHSLLNSNITANYPFMSYSEVAAVLAIEHELIPDVVPHPVVHTSVVQANETSWDFLVRLGREVGYVAMVTVDAMTGLTYLYFGPPTPNALVETELGDEAIGHLSASTSASGIGATASTRGWDQSLAVPAVGEAPPASATAVTAILPEELALEFAPTGQRISLERLAENEAATEAASAGFAMRLAGAFANLEGEVRGDPTIRPRTAIALLKAGMLTGEYTVSAAQHLFAPNMGGYRTSFTCSGQEDRSLRGLATPPRQLPTLHGVYPAIVTDVEDPEGLGRVLLSFPWLAETYVSTWARVIQAGAGPSMGTQILPEPLDEVLVAFENGQLDAPYVLGGLYSIERQGAIGAETLVQGVTMKRAFTSRTGHQLIFDDSPETPGVLLQTTFGASCMIRMSPETGIVISTVEEQPIVINSASEVTVNSEGAVVINAADVTINGEGDVSISAEGAIEISAAEELNLAATSVTVEAEDISLVAGEINIAGGIVSLGI
jgi:phage protein D